MEGDFTFESMLKEVKKSLSKYENIIKEIENYPSKKKISRSRSN